MEERERRETPALTRRHAARGGVTLDEAGREVAWEAPEPGYEVPCPHCVRWRWADDPDCPWCGGKQGSLFD